MAGASYCEILNELVPSYTDMRLGIETLFVQAGTRPPQLMETCT